MGVRRYLARNREVWHSVSWAELARSEGVTSVCSYAQRLNRRRERKKEREAGVTSCPVIQSSTLYRPIRAAIQPPLRPHRVTSHSNPGLIVPWPSNNGDCEAEHRDRLIDVCSTLKVDRLFADIPHSPLQCMVPSIKHSNCKINLLGFNKS